jgi:predicted Zn-dependent protease
MRTRHLTMAAVHRAVRRRVALLALAATTLSGCAVNPVTGRTQIMLISEAQEVEIGRQGAADIESSIGLVDDAALQQYVEAIGLRMAATSERPHLPWRFRVLDDPTPNAFALPGGFIYVTRGILSLMNSEAELAAVLGHEIGHVTARHSANMISRAQLTQIGFGLGALFLPGLERFGGLASAGLQLLFLSYGREAEREADDLGFRYSLQHNYDVRAMPNVFASLARIGELEGRSPLPAWLSSHPFPGERIERIEAQIAQLDVPLANLRLGVAEFYPRIDRLVYGVNPRNGFFRGTLYLHPELRFQLTFPANWRTQNMARAVIAGSPQQDAMMELTLAQTADLDAAAQRFFAQQGIQQGQISRTSINQLPAIAGSFTAQTQQGAVTGWAVFISYENRVYQLLGYAAAARFPAYDQAIRAAAGSFNRLTDQQALAVQPNRIHVVTLPQAMTFAQFQQRYPSVIPAGELAIINQVPAETTTLPASARMKRVAP